MTGLDTENAFLESDLEETFQFNLPKDVYSHKNGKVVVVVNGLKEAGELFYKLMKEY